MIENIAEGEESVYNLLAVLREYSDLTQAHIQDLANDFEKGAGGNCEITLGGTRYYLVYETRDGSWWGLSPWMSSMPV